MKGPKPWYIYIYIHGGTKLYCIVEMGKIVT